MQQLFLLQDNFRRKKQMFAIINCIQEKTGQALPLWNYNLFFSEVEFLKFRGLHFASVT